MGEHTLLFCRLHLKMQGLGHISEATWTATQSDEQKEVYPPASQP